MQIPRFRCKMTLHLIPEPEEKGSELLRDLTANDNGANRWHLYEDLKQSNKFRMEVVVPSWKQHLLQLERTTKNEKYILLKLRNLRIDPNPPEEWISLSVDKEVLNRRVRTGGLPQVISINKLLPLDRPFDPNVHRCSFPVS